ncbi:hypothetical protein E4T38_09170 [Aureobasidium subglaciale]|nr:hypothetical protein E4T38_09170 [Aureobasidium subglaciale]KAI5216966.1 hypothetical protein E4T41_09044 [Aureobasidium subglaciale]
MARTTQTAGLSRQQASIMAGVQECTSYGRINIGSTIYSPTSSAAELRASCSTGFSSSLDKLFKIYGRNWDDTLGNGDILRDASVRRNGNDVSDCEFTSPPNDGTTWDFLASGQMSGISSCYGQAAIDAEGCRVGGSKTMPSSI